MKFEFLKDGRPLDAKEWYAQNDEMSNTACAPIHVDGEVVALVVIGEDEGIGQLIGRGTYIVRACNAHERLVKALEEIVKNDPCNVSSAGIIARKALAAAKE
jgi:hypothetical protein